MLAASTGSGMRAKAVVPTATMPSISRADTMLANGVCAPEATLMAERDMPPPTGMPPKNEAMTFDSPRPTNSWLASTRSRRFMARARAMVMFCTVPIKASTSAGSSKVPMSPSAGSDSCSAGRPLATSPTSATP